MKQTTPKPESDRHLANTIPSITIPMLPMTLTVRPATADDAQAVLQVGEEAFAETRSVYRPNVAAIASLSALSPTLERLVAEDAGRVVGTVRFGVAGDVVRVIGLGVHPQWRRRGVARALLDALVSVARRHCCRALTLYTIVQAGNVPIFRRLGFSVVSEQPDEYCISVSGEPLTEARMERHAASPSNAS